MLVTARDSTRRLAVAAFAASLAVRLLLFFFVMGDLRHGSAALYGSAAVGFHQHQGLTCHADEVAATAGELKYKTGITTVTNPSSRTYFYICPDQIFPAIKLGNSSIYCSILSICLKINVPWHRNSSQNTQDDQYSNDLT